MNFRRDKKNIEVLNPLTDIIIMTPEKGLFVAECPVEGCRIVFFDGEYIEGCVHFSAIGEIDIPSYYEYG